MSNLKEISNKHSKYFGKHKDNIRDIQANMQPSGFDRRLVFQILFDMDTLTLGQAVYSTYYISD